MRQHYDEQQKERLNYARHVKVACENPDQYTSIAIDGMDQFKTRLPRIIPFDKRMEAKAQLTNHVIAAKVHGQKPRIFVDFNQVIPSLIKKKKKRKKEKKEKKHFE